VGPAGPFALVRVSGLLVTRPVSVGMSCVCLCAGVLGRRGRRNVDRLLSRRPRFGVLVKAVWTAC
jgi:hypothetical protein